MQQSSRTTRPGPASHLRGISRKRGEYLLFQCLIVSGDECRQRQLSEAASRCGWDVVVCADAEAAVEHQQRRFVQLVICDLPHDFTGQFPEMLTRFSETRGLLLVICGNSVDVEEEIWARQLGAWLYLPGADCGADLDLICEEARNLVERLHARSALGMERRRLLMTDC